MKLKFYLLLFFVLTTYLAAQTTLTPIPGTKYSMIPPEGFVISPNFSGFQNNETGSSIIIVDLPTDFAELDKSFTKDALKSKGITLISKEKVKHNNSDASLIKVSQKGNGINYLKQILVFGEDSKTVIVNAVYPEKYKSFENEIYKSLLTVKYDDKQISDPLSAAPFSINTDGTSYQFVKSMVNSLLFTGDGKLPSEKGLLIVSASLGEFSAIDQKEFAVERFKKLPNGTEAIIKKVENITISDMKGFEIIAEGKEKEMQYQVILFAPEKYYLIYGEAKTDLEKNLEIFKKVAKTFMVK